MRALQNSENKNWEEVNDLCIRPDNEKTLSPEAYDLEEKVSIFNDKLNTHLESV